MLFLTINEGFYTTTLLTLRQVWFSGTHCVSSEI